MRLWVKGIVGLLMVALQIWIGVRIGGFMISFLQADGGSTVRDPMFAEEQERTTRPPELDKEESGAGRFEDNSKNWTQENRTPVDMTAEELEKQARSADNS